MRIKSIDGYYFFDEDLMPKAPVVVEVGSFTGESARVMSGLYPACRFAAVEACLAQFLHLQDKIKDVSGSSVHNLALAAEDGPAKILHYEAGWDAAGMFDRSADGLVCAGEETVRGVRLDAMLNEVGVGSADLLLLNCEGSEIHALRDMVEDPGLRARVRQACVSFHCDHVRIYGKERRDELLVALSPYYDVVEGSMDYRLLMNKEEQRKGGWR